MKNIMKIVIALAFVAACFGQTSMTTTTLAAAQANTSNVLVVTSATGITAPGPNGSNLTLIVVDHEVEQVTAVSGTIISVVRGTNGTSRQPHVNAAVIWIGPDRAFARNTPGELDACTRASMAYVPVVIINATNGVNRTGQTYDCLGTAPAGVMVRTDSPGKPAVGATLASATTLALPTGTEFAVSGTTAVATIPVPAGFAAGMVLAIRPTGIFATTTAGNIGLITSATVVGRILYMMWDGSKWWPSYVS